MFIIRILGVFFNVGNVAAAVESLEVSTHVRMMDHDNFSRQLEVFYYFTKKSS